MKVMKVDLGTGFVGCDTTEYYELNDQSQTETRIEDWNRYEEMAVAHCESYGYDYQWWLEENGIDGDDDVLYNEYIVYCCEQGGIEIVEVEDTTEVDGDW